MQTVVFKQPPLVEIAAEFWWDIPGVQLAPDQTLSPGVPLPDASIDIHAMNFASKAGAKGFGFVERVIPPGFPLFAHQPTFRYRVSADASGGKPLFQLGPGIFTINLVPPYQSWDSFRPYIDLGLVLLFESRPPEEQNRSFSAVRLRYIDAFSEHLRQGLPMAKFLAERLGIDVRLPSAVTRFCSDPDALRLSLNVSMPISLGRYQLKIGHGWIRNTRALMMDTTIVCKGPLRPNKDALIDVLDGAHQVIHDSFVEMTQPLHKLMDPVTN